MNRTGWVRLPDTPPNARIDPGAAVACADLASACPVEGFGCPDRIDPFWDGIWDYGATASWISAEQAARQAGSGLTRLPARWESVGGGRGRMSAAEAFDILFSGRDRAARMRALAVIDMWRTASSEQIAAMSGCVKAAETRSGTAQALFASGAVDLGVFRNALAQTAVAGRATMMRPARTDRFYRRLMPMLTWPEWVSITGGRHWQFGGQFDRHNMLATELALRCYEYADEADVAVVLGEKFSRLDDLAGSGIGRTPPGGVNTRSADLTIVRPDGMRIAVELTASNSAHIAGKIERWARILSATPMRESGLVVVFLLAEPPGPKPAGYTGTRSALARRMSGTVKRWPGTPGDRVADRMFVADWAEWFPGRHLLGEGFFRLQGIRPLGRSGTDGRWIRADLAGPDRIGFDPADPDRLAAVIDNSQLLAGVPFWARDPAAAPPMWPLLVSGLGLDRVPEIDGEWEAELGAPRGIVGPAGIPPRLAGL